MGNLREIIEGISLPDYDRKGIALVAAGQKPATEFWMPLEGPGTSYDSPANIASLKKTLQGLSALSLVYGILAGLHPGERRDEPAQVQYRIAAANEPRWLERLLDARRADDDERLGVCFGFPQTAIDAYIGRIPRLPADARLALAKDSRYIEPLAFGTFIFSQDNVQAELQTGSRWARAVRSIDHQLYERIITHQLRQHMH